MIKDIDLPHVVQSHLINVTPTKETYGRTDPSDERKLGKKTEEMQQMSF